MAHPMPVSAVRQLRLPGIILLALLSPLAAQSPPQEIKVAAVQFNPKGSVEENTRVIIEKLSECTRLGVRIAVFQECATTGYVRRIIRETSAAQIESAEGAIAAACRDLNICAVVGTPCDIDGKRYNVAVVLDSEGRRLERYAKIQLVGGDDWATPGGRMSVFHIDGIPCSIIICHDERYPELVRLPVLAGARLVFCLSSESSLTEEHKIAPYRAQICARADENDVYIVHANSPAMLSHGQSRIVAPDGNILSEAGMFRDEIITADLDLSKATGQTARNSLRYSLLKEWWELGVGKVVVRD